MVVVSILCRDTEDRRFQRQAMTTLAIGRRIGEYVEIQAGKWVTMGKTRENKINQTYIQGV